MKKIFIIALAFVLALSLFSCGGDGDDVAVTTLEPIETVGIPEEELQQAVDVGNFGVNIYSTYAEIANYRDETESVTEITVPESVMGIPVKVIGEYAFYGDETLTKVILPSSILVIDRFAFEECKALEEVVVSEGLEVIDQAAFRNSSLSKINLPSTLAVIGKQSFYMTNLTELVIPDGIQAIPSFAFYGCKSLKSVTFGKRVMTVDEKAFNGCTSLEISQIPESIVSIGDYAFKNCPLIKDIFIPKRTGIGENAFYGCPSVVIYTPKGANSIKAAKTYGYEYVICESPDRMGK